MKALTVRQPWASLIGLGIKTIETRSWATKYRGPLAIHAGKHQGLAIAFPYGRGTHDDADALWRIKPNVFELPAGEDGFDVIGTAPLGAIVATAQLVDCVPMMGPLDVDDPIPHAVVVDNFGAGTLALFHEGDPFAIGCDEQLPFGDFRPGRWAWLLDDVKPTTERCPVCSGSGNDPSDLGWQHHGITEPGSVAACPACLGDRRCDPVPAKGRQGLWNWEPEAAA